jgi:hypothetical protein
MGLWNRELWGSTKRTNFNRIQSLQSKILRKIVDAPFYVTNLTIHNDLKVPFVHDLVGSRYEKFHESAIHHPNPVVRIPQFKQPTSKSYTPSQTMLAPPSEQQINSSDEWCHWAAFSTLVQGISYEHNYILQLLL